MALTGVAKAYARRIDRGEIALNDVPSSIRELVSSFTTVTEQQKEESESEPEQI